MRAFIAFPMPREVTESIWVSCKPLRRPTLKVKWVQPQNMHITLLFLGNIDDENAGKVAQALKRPSLKRLPFKVGFSGVGQFPPKGAARVLVSRLTEGAEECSAYFEQLKSELSGIVAPADKRGFQPHITLGRVKGRDPESRVQVDGSMEIDLSGSFKVGRCVLFESFLNPEGPTYQEVAAVDFLGSPNG